MKFDINKILEKLANNNYPLFVSERHLQVAFIIEANKMYPNYEYLPEYVYCENGIDYHIDLLVCDGNKESIAVEFKYVVAGGVINVPGDKNYALRNHSAIDIRRHQCIRDIGRLETYVKSKSLNCNKGYFILITNMPRFWLGSSNTSIAAQFDIPDKTVLKKGIHKPIGDSRFTDEYEPLKIDNDYLIEYKKYKEVDGKNGLFKSLCIEVK